MAGVSAQEGKKLKIMLVPISKSGTTLETISAFTYLYANLSQNADIDLDCTVVTDLKAPVENAPLLQLAENLAGSALTSRRALADASVL